MRKKDLFESKRLRARQPSLDEIDFFIKCVEDPEIMKYQGGSLTDEYLNNYRIGIQDHWKKHGFGNYLVIDKNSDDFIGGVSLKYITGGDHQDIPDLGFFSLPKYWNQGFTKEIASKCVEYGLTTLKMKQIQAHCKQDNIGAANVLKHIGFCKIEDIELIYLGKSFGMTQRWSIEKCL